MVQRRRARMVNPPRLLAHGNHPPPRGWRRCEVDVRHLGKRVPHLVVDCALRNLPALNVSNRNPQRQRHRCRRKHLIAVGNQQQDVGPPRRERIGKPQHRQADCLGHAGGGVRTQQALDLCLDGKPIPFHLRPRVAELRGKMRSHHKNAQLNIRVPRQFLERPIQMAIVGARGGNDGDTATGLRRLDGSGERRRVTHREIKSSAIL